jgi:Holliday junction resolvasome RuvABC endonuclease subunit
MDSKNYKPIIYGLLDFSEFKDVAERNAQTKKKINELIDIYIPEVVSLEDTFLEYYFNPKSGKKEVNAKAFRTLAKLQGVLECQFYEKNLCCYTWEKSEWRKTAGIHTSKSRDDQKAEAIDMVKEKFKIETDDDNIAEAILIAYATCIKVNKFV